MTSLIVGAALMNNKIWPVWPIADSQLAMPQPNVLESSIACIEQLDIKLNALCDNTQIRQFAAKEF